MWTLGSGRRMIRDLLRELGCRGPRERQQLQTRYGTIREKAID